MRCTAWRGVHPKCFSIVIYGREEEKLSATVVERRVAEDGEEDRGNDIGWRNMGLPHIFNGGGRLTSAQAEKVAMTTTSSQAVIAFCIL
ncbi:hypothetical protein L1887_35785 [Cichorium endivia]|nr:hypothetical protein L1887_35785 [Cichorium endivia]